MADIILVTGGSGKTGRAIIHALLARNRAIRALVHREEQAQPLKSLGVEQVVVGDMRSECTIRDVVRGVESIYHICPNVDPEELSIGRMIVSCARAGGVKHFVFHSVLHPQVELMPHHWLKLRVEEALFEPKLPFIKMFDYYDRYGLWGNPRVLRSLIGRAPATFQEFADRTLRERHYQNR